jgi:hypothetical protein
MEGEQMADIDKLIRKCRRGSVKMRPVLPLGQAMSLGMVGYLDDHAFRYVGTVETMLGMKPSKPLPGSGSSSVEIASGKDVALSGRMSGETSEAFGDLAKAKARIEVTFQSDRSFLLLAHDLTISTLANPAALLTAMQRAYGAGLWRKEYCFVYQIATAASYRAALSHQAGAKLLLSADAGVGPSGVSLGDLGGKTRFEAQSGAIEQLISNRPVRAFFNAYKVKDHFFRGPAVAVASRSPLSTQQTDQLPTGSLFETV